MKRPFIPFLIAFLFLTLSIQSQAQKASKVNYKGEKELRTVRGCEYEVLRGLAEIVEVKKVKGAAESALGHDEYNVKFKFISMEGGDLLPTLREETFDFMLRSGLDKVPVGPKYIKHYHVRVGTKFAMQFLQNRKGECGDKYTYESGGIPNDLFESQDNLMEYKKRMAEEKLFQKELEVANKTEEVSNKTFTNTPNPNKMKDPDSVKAVVPTKIDTPKVEEPKVDTPKVEEPKVEEPKVIIKDLNEEELRKQIEAEMRAKNGLDKKKEDISMDSLRAQLEAQVREELEAKQKIEDEERRKNALKDEKKRAKDAAAQAKEEAARKAVEEKILQEQIEAKKAEMRKEIEAQIQAEVLEKKKKEEEEARKKQLLKDQIANEIRRGSCVYQEKVSGTIEILSVNKAVDEAQSIHGYTEYEVKVRFRPDNYADIAKKDRKIWDDEHTFYIDPKGKSANPSATYVRKNQVFKGNKYVGFAQVLESGICNTLMIYAPDLPIDASHVK